MEDALLLAAVAVAIVATVGGTVLARRPGWSFLHPALLALAVSMGTGVLLAFLALLESAFPADRSATWLDDSGFKIGGGLAVLAAGFFVACMYFFIGACFGALRRSFYRGSQTNVG